MFKKILIFLVIFLMLFFASLGGMSHIFNRPAISNTSLKAQDSIIVIKVKAGSSVIYINGESKVIDTPPEIVQSRMFVPVHFIIDVLGGETNWYNATKQVSVKTNFTTIIFWIGKPNTIVNGASKSIESNNQNVVPYIKNGRAMIPVRFLAEELGYYVEYDNATSTATIYNSEKENLTLEITTVKLLNSNNLAINGKVYVGSNFFVGKLRITVDDPIKLQCLVKEINVDSNGNFSYITGPVLESGLYMFVFPGYGPNGSDIFAYISVTLPEDKGNYFYLPVGAGVLLNGVYYQYIPELNEISFKSQNYPLLDQDQSEAAQEMAVKINQAVKNYIKEHPEEVFVNSIIILSAIGVCGASNVVPGAAVACPVMLKFAAKTLVDDITRTLAFDTIKKIIDKTSLSTPDKNFWKTSVDLGHCILGVGKGVTKFGNLDFVGGLLGTTKTSFTCVDTVAEIVKSDDPKSTTLSLVSLLTSPLSGFFYLPLTITINSPIESAPLSITSSSPLTSGKVNQYYSYQLQATGGTPSYSWSLYYNSSPLPAGLQINSSGLISGTPTQSGTFNFIVQVRDSVGTLASKVFQITISENIQPYFILSLNKECGSTYKLGEHIYINMESNVSATGILYSYRPDGTFPYEVTFYANTCTLILHVDLGGATGWRTYEVVIIYNGVTYKSNLCSIYVVNP